MQWHSCMCGPALSLPPTNTNTVLAPQAQRSMCVISMQEAKVKNMKFTPQKFCGCTAQSILLEARTAGWVPQPPSVLICFDCCSLIIEDNKVRTFLSCRVCCLSLWPRLSEAAVPLDWTNSRHFQGPERQTMVATGARTK